MYALSVSAEGDCCQCVPPDLGIAAAALGASESGTLPSSAPAQALHTFTLDFGASRCFFRDSTTLTPLPAPVPVRLADPSEGPVVARSSTVLPCPAVPSGSLSGLHLPSFSTNLVNTAALQDAMVTTTNPGGQRVSICTCTRMGRHLATFTRRPGLSLYTLATEHSQVAASARVAASGQVAASCSCRLLSHRTLLWHHRLGHPSLPRLRAMHSCVLVSSLPRSLPPLPPSPAPPCLPCVEGRQRAAPHSSLFPPTTAPLQTLHMDVWGPARVSGQSRERYFLLVVHDYTRYTTVFPLQSKGQVVDVFIPWIRTVRLQLRERFGQDLPVLRLHSDRGGEFSSNLLRDFCRGEGILQSFTLPDSPQQNGIAERRIGLLMEVARTSMIHAAAPHFLWPFAVRYAAHQLNLWPRVSLPETSPTLRWTREVGDASVFRIWGSRPILRDTLADKLSPRGIPCVFLGFVPDAPSWQFYHPTSRRVFPSQDVTFDDSVPFYRLFPYRSTPPPPPPLFVALGPPQVDPLPPQGPAPSGSCRLRCCSRCCVGDASGGAEYEGAETGGAEPEGVATGGAEPGGVATGGGEPGGAEPEGDEPGGAASEGAESGGAEPQGAASSRGSAGASPSMSPQQLREWFVRLMRLRSGASGAGGAGPARAGGTGVAAGAGVTGGTATTDPGGARTRGTGAAGTGDVEDAGARDLMESCTIGSGGAGAREAGVDDPGAGGAGVGGLGVGERREPASRPVSPVRTARRVPRRVPRSHPHPVPGTHDMTLRPSSVSLRVPVPAPPESSLPEVPDPKSDRARAASPTISRLLATAVTDPSFESAAASSLVAELLDFAAACRLDYAIALVAQSASASPPSVRGRPGCTRHPDPALYAEAITGPYSSQWQAAMDAKMASWKSTNTYVNVVPPSGANIVDGMWIFRVKRPPGSPPAFKACYVARGFSQRQGVDYFQTFSPTPKMTTLRVLLHVAAQRDYKLHSLDFSTAFLQGSLHEEIWRRRPSGFTGTFPAGTQWSLHRPVYGLHQAPREWHDTLRTTLATLGFAPSTADPSLFLRTDTSLPPFYVLVYVDDLVFATPDIEALTLVKSELQKRHTCTDLGELRSYLGLQNTRDRARRTITLTQSHMVHLVLHRFGFQFSSLQPTPLSTIHSLSAPPSDESVEPSRPYPELVGCLMYLMTCTRPDLAYLLSLLTRYVAPGRHRKVHWDAAKRVLRYLCSTSGMGLVLGGRGPADLTGHADASWVDDSATQRSSQGYTFSQKPRSPLVMYVDNKAMIALCQEHRLEHKTKHIALRYFLARELQQRGQLRLAYVATRANTADVFTKALPPVVEASGNGLMLGAVGGNTGVCAEQGREKQTFINKLRTPLQIVLTFVVGLLMPFGFYLVCDAGLGIDIAPYCYIAVVVMLVLTATIVYIECFLALFLAKDPPDEPAAPYPPASAIIAAYLPNEADTILETIEAFLQVEYPGPLQVILAYNTPRDMPEMETILAEMARQRPDRFLAYRVVHSRSKAENVNAATKLIRGEFVGVFDADHCPNPDSFMRAWRWLSHGYDIVQGHCLVRNGDDNWVAQAVAVEFETIYAVGHPGSEIIHGFGFFGGSNGFWRSGLLAQIGMDGSMLTEDIDSSIRVLLAGGRIKSDPGLMSSELATTTLRQIWNQRLRWAQGWFQVSMRHFFSAMACRNLSAFQRLGLFHLFIWREIYPWISMQILPLLAFICYKANGFGGINWLDAVYMCTTIFTFLCGPVQLLFAFLKGSRTVRKHGNWWLLYLVFATLFYTEFKNVITRVAHVKEFMGEKAWMVTPRMVSVHRQALAEQRRRDLAVMVG
ncbi:unnamed protein product [Closterium sp. NIES-54]